MNKKKLPRAITRTADDMREAAATEWPEASARRANSNEPAAGRTAAPDVAPLDNVIEMAPKEAPLAFVASGSALPVPTSVDIDVARRQSLARAIVERHAKYSAVGGIIPLPVANLASITAIIVRMVKMLSDHYGVPFERDRARAIVMGLVGGTMPTGLAAVTASTLVYIVPGSNLIGLAVSSITAVACTRRIGRVFVEHFESGATLVDFPATERR